MPQALVYALVGQTLIFLCGGKRRGPVMPHLMLSDKPSIVPSLPTAQTQQTHPVLRRYHKAMSRNAWQGLSKVILARDPLRPRPRRNLLFVPHRRHNLSFPSYPFRRGLAAALTESVNPFVRFLTEGT